MPIPPPPRRPNVCHHAECPPYRCLRGACQCEKPKPTWENESRSCLFWFCAVCLFPLGLLLFLIPPQKRWVCVTCGYEINPALRP